MFRRIAGKIDPKVKVYIPNPTGPTPTPAAYTKLLMHFDTDFNDVSPSSHSITNNNVIIDNTYFVFGGGSADFGLSTANNLAVPYSADFAFGTGDFTIDFRLMLHYISGSYHNAFCQQGGGGFGWLICFTDGGLVVFRWASDTSDGSSLDQNISVSYSFSQNTWYHIKITCVSGSLYLFVDGICINPGGSVMGSGIFDPGADLLIGTDPYSPIGAEMDELRILNGLGDATTDFTVPVTPYAVV